MRLRHGAAAAALAAATTLAFASPASANHLNCIDFDSQEAAQSVFNADKSDPNDLDRDDDEIACEDNPSGGSALSDAEIAAAIHAEPEAPAETEEPEAPAETEEGEEEMTMPEGGVEAGGGNAGIDGGALAAGGAALLAAGGVMLYRRKITE